MFGPLFIVVALLILGALVYAAVFLERNASSRESKASEVLPFQLKHHFFTSSEFQFFTMLRAKLDRQHYDIFPKVRMGDYIKTTNGGTERFGSWNRIKSRHVDFVIWDNQGGKLAMAIELDGNSHNGDRAKKADDFKDEVFKIVGLEIVRVRVGSDFAAEIEKICQRLV